jgi:hypothetical protein
MVPKQPQPGHNIPSRGLNIQFPDAGPLKLNRIRFQALFGFFHGSSARFILKEAPQASRQGKIDKPTM